MNQWGISFHTVVVFGLGKQLENFLEMKSFHGAKILKNPSFKFNFPIFFPHGHLMDYLLPNVDNHGHFANYHLPHFVHVVIERPPGSGFGSSFVFQILPSSALRKHSVRLLSQQAHAPPTADSRWRRQQA